MKNRNRNFFRADFIQKYLKIAFIVVLFSSCEKDTFIENYSFQNYLFSENMRCYDTLGNQHDSLSYMFSENDFIFTDEFHLPYKNIEIVENNSFVINYVLEGNSKTKRGVIDHKNDSVYFFVDEIDPYNLLLKGKFINNQLRVSGCGFIYYVYIEDMLIYESKSKTASLSIPEISSLLDDFPNPRVNNNRICRKYLYFQSFDLVYDRISE